MNRFALEWIVKILVWFWFLWTWTIRILIFLLLTPFSFLFLSILHFSFLQTCMCLLILQFFVNLFVFLLLFCLRRIRSFWLFWNLSEIILWLFVIRFQYRWIMKRLFRLSYHSIIILFWCRTDCSLGHIGTTHIMICWSSGILGLKTLLCRIRIHLLSTPNRLQIIGHAGKSHIIGLPSSIWAQIIPSLRVTFL